MSYKDYFAKGFTSPSPISYTNTPTPTPPVTGPTARLAKTTVGQDYYQDQYSGKNNLLQQLLEDEEREETKDIEKFDRQQQARFYQSMQEFRQLKQLHTEIIQHLKNLFRATNSYTEQQINQFAQAAYNNYREQVSAYLIDLQQQIQSLYKFKHDADRIIDETLDLFNTSGSSV